MVSGRNHHLRKIVKKNDAVKIVTNTNESWQFGEVTVNAVALYGEQGKRVGPPWFNVLDSSISTGKTGMSWDVGTVK